MERSFLELSLSLIVWFGYNLAAQRSVSPVDQHCSAERLPDRKRHADCMFLCRISLSKLLGCAISLAIFLLLSVPKDSSWVVHKCTENQSGDAVYFLNISC